jgi:hypothetical protein
MALSTLIPVYNLQDRYDINNYSFSDDYMNSSIETGWILIAFILAYTLYDSFFYYALIYKAFS